MTSLSEQLQLGHKIRLLRENIGQSLEEFARHLGLTRKLLDDMENNRVSAPVAMLINIAHFCGVELHYFFASEEEEPSWTIVHEGDARIFKRLLPKGKNPLSYTYLRLAPEKVHKKMEPFLVEFTLSGERVPQVAHDGEEFMYVLSGRLECHYGKEVIHLKKGDAFYYESKVAHAFRAVGGDKAVAIVVLYPY